MLVIRHLTIACDINGNITQTKQAALWNPNIRRAAKEKKEALHTFKTKQHEGLSRIQTKTKKRKEIEQKLSLVFSFYHFANQCLWKYSKYI